MSKEAYAHHCSVEKARMIAGSHQFRFMVITQSRHAKKNCTMEAVVPLVESIVEKHAHASGKVHTV